MAGVIFAFLEFVLRRDVQSWSCWSSDQLDVSSSTRQKMKSSSGLDQRFCPSTYTQNIPCDEFYMRPLHALYKQSFSPETVWEGCCQTALKEQFTQKTHCCKNLNESSDYPITLQHLSVLNRSPDGPLIHQSRVMFINRAGDLFELVSGASGREPTGRERSSRGRKKKRKRAAANGAVLLLSAAQPQRNTQTPR